MELSVSCKSEHLVERFIMYTIDSNVVEPAPEQHTQQNVNIIYFFIIIFTLLSHNYQDQSEEYKRK